MRNNLPVTNVEVQLDEHTLIVSKTDLKGQITYINKDFIDISGFTEAELIGQPHNIVRHPDMPAEAFADFWQDLKDDRPWTGLVKNRCKNGDYYWVLANATPLRENGKVVSGADLGGRSGLPGNSGKAGGRQGNPPRQRGQRWIDGQDARLV